MQPGPLNDQIVQAFDAMSGQLQTAARYMLDHSRDVALLSMREQARQAGVQPATMTRLAKHLGFDGYDNIRELYAEAVRDGDLGFAGKAGAQVVTQQQHGDRALAADMLASISRQITHLGSEANLERIVGTAEALAGARRIYCLGLRSSHPVSWHLYYVLRLISEKAVHLDGIAGTVADGLGTANEADILLVTSVQPYTRQSIELAEHAHGRGVGIVAITDSEVAPLAQIARHAVIVPTDSPSFFHTMAPAFAVAEVLAAIVTGHGGEEALASLRRTDEHLASLDIHTKPKRAKRAT